MSKKTLFDKVWEAHIVESSNDGTAVLYIDRHLIHEVTSPQAFDGLRKHNLPIFRPLQTLATVDHNVPTINQHLPNKDAISAKQIKTLEENCKDFGLELFGLGHPNQGIVHVIAPELGITLPGMTIVCGDSHTSTHGAFGAIAFGIGTSEVEHVLGTQCLLQSKPKQMKIEVNGTLGKGVTAKDIILYIISKITSSGATGFFVEYTGSTFSALSIEERMTVCNMSIEMGARGGLIAPDQKTFDYIQDKPFAPKGERWEKAINYWKTLSTDSDASFDVIHTFEAKNIEPMITYGTNPGMGMSINELIPSLQDTSFDNALQYMGLKKNESLIGKKINWVFIGSCTNARIEDLREVANFVKGKKKSDHVNALIVPGSRKVLEQAKEEGIELLLNDAGFVLREPGCSACLAMNEDKIPSGEYCVSTSNRNFEGRQGPGARTLLVSPLMAAAIAIKGEIIDVRNFLN
jgi:3-isopropylmalate/(R)-2-methylmalate dehydratase large subunit